MIGHCVPCSEGVSEADVGYRAESFSRSSGESGHMTGLAECTPSDLGEDESAIADNRQVDRVRSIPPRALHYPPPQGRMLRDVVGSSIAEVIRVPPHHVPLLARGFEF
jgi:hypothetical protein